MKNKVIYTHISEVCLEKSIPFFPILQTTIEKTNEALILTATETEARDIKRTLIKSTNSSALPQIMSLNALLTVTNTTHKKTRTEQYIDIKKYLKKAPSKTQWFNDIKNKQGFIRHLATASTLTSMYPFDSKIYTNHHPLGFGKSHQSLKLIQKISEITPETTALTPFEAERLAAYTEEKTLILIGLTHLTLTEKERLTHIINRAQTCIAWVYDNATEDVLHNPHHFYSFIKTNWTLSEIQQISPEIQENYHTQLITKHQTQKDEIIDVLHTIVHALESNEITLDQIQILTQSPGAYTALFRDYCELLNLPFNAGKKPLNQYKVIEFLLLALNTKAEEYSRTSLLNWLKSPIWKPLSNSLDFSFFDWLMKEYALHGELTSIQNAIEQCVRFSPTHTIDATFAQNQLQRLNKIDSLLETIEKAPTIYHKLTAISDFINTLALNHTEETTFITSSFLNTIRSLESKLTTQPYRTFYAELFDMCTLSTIQIPTPPHHAVLRIDTIDHYIHNPRKICFVLGAQNIGTPTTSMRSIFFPNNLKKRLQLPNTQSLTKQYLCHNLRTVSDVRISITQDTPEIESALSPTLEDAFHFLNWKSDIQSKYENTVILPKKKSLKKWTSNDTQNTFGELDIKSKKAWQTQVKEKSFSPTALESYQRCQYRYYLENVLNEKIVFKKNDDVQAHVWGSFLHHILHVFYERFQKTDKRVRSFNLKEASALIESIAKSLLKHKEYAHFYWRVKSLLLLNQDNESGLLSTILNHEAEDETELYPSEFESRFKEIEITLNNGTHLSLNGAIDMIMKDASQPGIAILDYKTGKKIPTRADIYKFRHLQLPLYLMVAKQLYPNTPILGGIIFQINSPDRCEKKVVMTTKDAKKEVFKLSRQQPAILDSEFEEKLITHVSLIHSLIYNGYFSHAHHPHLTESETLRKQTCTSCTYWNACQYSERFK